MIVRPMIVRLLIRGMAGAVLGLLTLPGWAIDPELGLQEQAAFKAAAEVVAPSVLQVIPFGGADVVEKTRVATAPGSAVVLTADGYLMTSAFLLAGSPSALLVTLPEGRRVEARVIATDHPRLLSLLKIDATDLTVPTPADAGAARVGQWTLAVGKAFDPAVPNVSAGLLSAKERIWGRALQTDCKTSPFNYGGALVDLRGGVLGVIVPLSMTDEGVMAGVDWYDSGIGFAIPFDQVRESFERLRQGQDIKRGVLGIALKTRGPFAEPVVGRIAPESPAAKAGLQEGDRLLTVAGRSITRQAEIQRALGPHAAGDEILIRFRRGDQEQETTATLAEPAPPKKPAAP